MSVQHDPITSDAINRLLKKEWPSVTCACTEVSETHAVAELNISSSSVRPGGYISGPSQFAVADAALWFLCFGASGRLEPLALTSDLSIRFLRPAHGKVIHARADLDKASARSVIGSVQVWTNDPYRPTSIATGAYILPRTGD